MLRGSYKRVLDLGAENFSEAEEVQCLAASAGVAILGRQTVTGVLPVWLGVHGRYRCRWQEEEAGPESDAGIRKVFPPPFSIVLCPYLQSRGKLASYREILCIQALIDSVLIQPCFCHMFLYLTACVHAVISVVSDSL